jgi:hypothetical protein
VVTLPLSLCLCTRCAFVPAALQVFGTKRFYLVHPKHFAGMYPYPTIHPCDRQSQVYLASLSPPPPVFPLSLLSHPLTILTITLSPSPALLISLRCQNHGMAVCLLYLFFLCTAVGKVRCLM